MLYLKFIILRFVISRVYRICIKILYINEIRVIFKTVLGNRGKNYAGYAEQFPDLMQVVAVAEPREYARSLIQKRHSLPQDR